MAAPTRVSFATTRQSGTTACSIDISGVADGSWMIAVITADTTGVPTPPAGWTQLQPISAQIAIGSRRVSIAGRIKQSGDTTLTWNSTASSNKRLTLAWGTGATAVNTWTFGTIGVRSAGNVVSGESVQTGSNTTTVAPSVTASTDSLVLSLFVEATTSTGAGSITAGNATLWFNAGDEATWIEQHSMGYETPAAGATSAVTMTYSQSQASNSLGVQIVLPTAAAPEVRTATGGITLSGTAVGIPAFARTASSGFTLAGTADGQSAGGAVTRTATGTFTMSGSAAGIEREVVTATGGMSLAITGATAEREYATASSGITMSGSADALYARPGFTSVAQFLGTPGATAAWRLGGGPFPQHSEYAADQSIYLGYGALEFSCGWTSDLVPFGLGPQYLDTMAGVSGNVDPTTMTWATLSSTYVNKNNPVSPGVYQPFYKLEDALAKYAGSYVMIVDPKFGFDTISKIDVMLNLCDAYGGPTKIMIKFDSPTGSTNLTTRAHARGYTCINYWGTDTTSLASQQGNWDCLGMSYLASSGNWTTAKSYGKPVWAAVVPDQAGYNTAWTNSGGFNFANVSGVTSVAPVSAGPSAQGILTLGGSATGFARYAGTASSGVTLAGTAAGVEREIATASSGVVLGGTATHSEREVATATGGLVLGGTAAPAVGSTAIGVVTLGGSVTHVEREVTTASSGLTLTGAADGSAAGGTPSRTASGGLALSGSAASVQREVRTATSGITLGSVSVGAASGGSSMVTATGGLTLSGSTATVASYALMSGGSVTLGGTAVASVRATATAIGALFLSGTTTISGGAIEATAEGALILTGVGQNSPEGGWPDLPAIMIITPAPGAHRMISWSGIRRVAQSGGD